MSSATRSSAIRLMCSYLLGKDCRQASKSSRHSSCAWAGVRGRAIGFRVRVSARVRVRVRVGVRGRGRC